MNKDNLNYKLIDGYSVMAVLYIIFGSVTSIRICAFGFWAILVAIFMLCRTEIDTDKKI